MNIFLLLGIALGLGILAARLPGWPARAVHWVNRWVLWVALPALVLLQVAALEFHWSLLFPALAPWGVLLGAALCFPWLGQRLGWERGTVGALVLTCGLGNTAFLGLPLVAALQGPQALGPAVIADQLGSFLALSTVGVWIAAKYSGRAVQPAELLRRVLLFPAFGALVLAVAVGLAGGWPNPLAQGLGHVASTLTPLALFSVGLQFRIGDFGRWRGPMALGLGWKLLLAPLLVWAVAAMAAVPALPATATILQCAMAPMITAGLLAQQSRLNPPLANAVVSAGILLSLLTVPLWSWILS